MIVIGRSLVALATLATLTTLATDAALWHQCRILVVVAHAIACTCATAATHAMTIIAITTLSLW